MNQAQLPSGYLEVRQLAKSYNSRPALKSLSLTINPGEIFGLVGPDGAGKTTLLRMLAGLLQPDTGSITLGGNDLSPARGDAADVFGYMPQRFSLYEDLTLTENLDFFAAIYGLAAGERQQRISFFLELTGLTPHQRKLAGQLSGGMKQKLALAVNLLHRPEILLLDEPSTGVDPVARREFWKLLEEMQAQGTTILVATPDLEEAGRCHRLLLLHQGEALALGTGAQVTGLFPWPILALNCPDPFAVKQRLQGHYPWLLESAAIYGNNLRLATQHPLELEQVLAREWPTSPLAQNVSPTLADAYIYLTHRRSADVI